MQKRLLLEENYGLAAATLSCIGDGIISTDLSGKIVYMNLIAEEIVGCTEDYAKGKQFEKIFALYDVETKLPLESPVSYVLEHKTKTGLLNNSVLILDNNVQKYISATCTPVVSEDGNMIGVVIVFRDITKLKTLEKYHLNEENKLKEMFDNTPTGMLILDMDSNIIKANEIVLIYADKKNEDVQGKRFGDCVNCLGSLENEKGCGYGNRCRECNFIRAVETVITSKKSLSNIEIHMELIKNKIEYEAWFRVSMTPLFDVGTEQVAVTFVDITTSKKQEIQAIEDREYSINILNQLPYTVWIADENFKWKYVNRTHGEITGISFLNTPLEQWFEFIHPDDMENYKAEAYKCIQNRCSFVREVRFRSRANVYRWALVIGAPFYNSAGIFTGYIGTTYDITIQKESEENLKRYQEMLITAKEAAETANRAKSEFLANMSHEIRTPINGIVGMIDLTLLSTLNEDQKDNLITAKACANSLIKIVNDILDFSKMEAGKLVIENINFNLKDLLEEIVRSHTPKVNDKGLELNYTFSSNIPQILIGDPNRLRQILNNLISNAVKFTERGEISVSIKCCSLLKDEVKLRFTVTDTGIGIAEKDIDLLFQSFSQVDNSYTRKYGGTGLGLVISKQLVEKMGGSIEVESKKGVGSTFQFYLKFKIGNALYMNQIQYQNVIKAKQQLHILLVEDDQINQKVILKMLHEKGYIVKTANNGVEAVDYYRREQFDVILMDIQMPFMNGVEAAQKINNLEKINKHTPIVAITAYALPGDKEKFLNNGMDAYISKPIQMEELFSVLEQVTMNTKYHTPDHVYLTEDGEIKFTFDKTINQAGENKAALEKIAGIIKDLEAEAKKCNLEELEKLANEVKRISINIDLIDMKDTAFKIELAARRFDMTEAKRYIEQIKYEFQLHHSSKE